MLKLCGWSKLPWDTHQHQKIAPKDGSRAEIDYKNAVPGRDCSAASGDGGYGLVAYHKMVTAVPIHWSEEGHGLAGSDKGE